MSSLEELLIASGAMTEAQLDIVRAEKVRKGGSLDTNILALGYLTEHALQRLLEQTFPRIPGTSLAAEPTPEALALLDAERSRALGAVPQRVEGRQLHVLMDDEATLTLLAEEPSLQAYELVPVAVNEVRLRFLQERLYGLPRDKRYVEIMDRLLARAAEKAAVPRSHSDFLIGDPLAGLEPEWMSGAILLESNVTPSSPGGDPEAIPLLEQDLLLEATEGEPSEWDEDTAARPLVEVHQALTVDGFGAALDATTSMDDLPEIFFRFGVPCFQSVALFKVQSNMVMGWRGAGLGIASDLIRGIVVPMQSDTFLGRAIESGVWVGQAAENPVEERIAEQLGASHDAQMVTGAVKVAGRPVLVVCGVTEGQAPDPRVVMDFARLCEQASETVLRLILARKQSPPSEDAPAGPVKKKASKKKTTRKKSS